MKKINSVLEMARRALAGVQISHLKSVALALLISGGLGVEAQTAPPSGQFKLVVPSVSVPSVSLAIGGSAPDTNAPTASKATNGVVADIQAQLKVVLDSVEAATAKMTTATHSGAREQAQAVDTLAARIDTLVKNNLGDDSPFLHQADELIRKMDEQIKLAQSRAGDPQILPQVQQEYAETATQIRDSLTRLRSARAAVNGVRSDLLTQAQGLRERKEFLGFLADAQIGESAADAFVQALTDIHQFCRRLEKTIAGVDPIAPPLIVEGRVVN
jgi:hypothetical protein